MMRRSVARRAGLTLIELLLVIGILLVLGTVSVVSYTRIKEGTDKKATKIMVDSTVEAVTLFQIEIGRYPSEDEGLQALINVPDDEIEAKKWRDGGGPWLKDGKIPVDPWGNELKYEFVEEEGTTPTGPPFHIWSLGPDKEDGTEDDIRNWSEPGT